MWVLGKTGAGKSTLLTNLIRADMQAGRDAEVLGVACAPECRAADLMYLPAYHMCLKLLVDGTTSPPFTVSTFQAPQPQVSHRDQIIATTRARYCHPVAEVERDILHAWHTQTPSGPAAATAAVFPRMSPKGYLCTTECSVHATVAF